MRDGIWEVVASPHWRRFMKACANEAECVEPGHLQEEATRTVARDLRPHLPELRLFREMANQPSLINADRDEKLKSHLLRRALEHAARRGSAEAGFKDAVEEFENNQIRSARADLLRQDSGHDVHAAVSRARAAMREVVAGLANEAFRDGKVSVPTTKDATFDLDQPMPLRRRAS